MTNFASLSLLALVAFLGYTSAAVLDDPLTNRFDPHELSGDEPESYPVYEEDTGVSDTPECTCVSYDQCDDNFGDMTIISPRLKPTCDHYMMVCCVNVKQTPEPPVEPTVVPVDPWTCSKHNPMRGLIDARMNLNKEDTKYGQFPWMAAVMNTTYDDSDFIQNNLMCGGSIIHPQVVLTAAHCVKGKQNILVRAGEYDLQQSNELYPTQEQKVVDVIIHEAFYAPFVFNDVALLVLESPLEASPVVGTVCLPEQDEIVDNRHCMASGWGKDQFGEEGQYQTILKEVPLNTIPHKMCQEELRKSPLGFNYILNPSFICAQGINGQDTCTGDGGGPLVCPSKDNPEIYVQAGIVSWGVGCGSEYPAAYVNVPLYRNWIDGQLNSLVSALRIQEIAKQNRSF